MCLPHSTDSVTETKTHNKKDIIVIMEGDYWWKVYLDTVFQNPEDLDNYARQYNQSGDNGVRQRLGELYNESGRFELYFCPSNPQSQLTQFSYDFN